MARHSIHFMSLKVDDYDKFLNDGRIKSAFRVLYSEEKAAKRLEDEDDKQDVRFHSRRDFVKIILEEVEKGTGSSSAAGGAAAGGAGPGPAPKADEGPKQKRARKSRSVPGGVQLVGGGELHMPVAGPVPASAVVLVAPAPAPVAVAPAPAPVAVAVAPAPVAVARARVARAPSPDIIVIDD